MKTTATGYRHLRLAAQALDHASAQAPTAEVRAELDAALHALYQSSDAVGRAMAVEHGLAQAA